MLHAQPLPASTRWCETGPATEPEVSSRREAVGQAMLGMMQMSVFVLSIACLLITSMTLALAQPRAQESRIPSAIDTHDARTSEGTASAFDPAAFPPLDSIGAQTDIAVFLKSGVPIELQVAALRRAWTTDAAIRDFERLAENDWDFDNLSSIPGFGEIGPEVDVRTMVARIFGEPTRLAALQLTPHDERTSSSSLANLARRLIFGTVQY